MVYIADLNPAGATHVGSNPTLPTKKTEEGNDEYY